MNGVLRHPPGKLSPLAVVDVGLKCPHSCKHCFYSFLDGSEDQFAGMRRARWHNLENLLALVDSIAESGFVGFDVTGGEPTAYPGIVDVIARATERGLSSRIITLAQFLPYKNLLPRLLDAGLCDFRFSLHAVDPEMFHRMTGGELSRMVAAMDELGRRGFQYVTNTTITEENYRSLPDIAKFIASRPEIYQATLLFFMPYYRWAAAEHVGEHRVRYSDIAAVLREAVGIIEDAEIGCTIRYAPHCTVVGMEANHVGIAGVRHDPHEWMNAIDHTADPDKVSFADAIAMGHRIEITDRDQAATLLDGPAPFVAIRSSKVFPEKCRGCPTMAICDGVDQAYLEKFGDGEFVQPGRFRGDVIDFERLRYLPAFVLKTAPDGDARGAVRAAFTEMRAGLAP